MVSRLLSAGVARILHLPRPLTRQVSVRRDIGLRARDGVILRTDHYAPALPGAPVVLIRTPYGRGGITAVLARTFAEQGFHCVVSSCRGTGGSTGRFEPMRHERDDGLDTVDWLRRQPWFTGRLGMFGPSYVGFTQWAIADVPELAAMATAVTVSQFREPMYAGGAFALFTTLAWAALIQSQSSPWFGNAVELLRGQPRLHRAFAHLPLGEVDQLATGAEVAFFRQWLELAGPRGDAFTAYWDERDHDRRLAKVSAAVLMVGGWHDIFLPWQLHDYAALRAAGAQPYLTIGPWTHGSAGLAAASVPETLAWLRAHLRDETSAVRERPVRVFVEGGVGWRDLESWPPPSDNQPWHLHDGGVLTTAAPRPSIPDRFVYDPTDPTPSVGGPLLVDSLSGPRDNRELEARPDVLVYTSVALPSALEITGPVTATIHVRASRPYHDVFVRLCDVSPDGRSRNICDGLSRVTPGRYETGPAGVSAVEVELWPAAYRFHAGHRIRVQVSAGAHPRYARNPGSSQPLGTAVRLHPVEIEVWHDPERPSAIRLPVTS